MNKQALKSTGLEPLLSEVLEDPRVLRLVKVLGKEAQLHLVGGTVRDALLGTSPKDLDFASKFTPDILTEKLNAAGIKVVPTGLKHQTVTCIPLENYPSVEITTFRGPFMSPKGGIVSSQTINEDLCYRDFSINAIAVEIITKQLIDNHDGLKDLHARIIRAVGDAKMRFSEDPLRIIRMVRFACLEGFKVDNQTLECSKQFADQIPDISIERVREEFSKILLSTNPDIGMDLLYNLGFLHYFLPEVLTFVDFEQNRFHKADLFRHTLEVVKNVSPILELRLAALLHDVGKPCTLSIGDDDGERHFYRHESVGADMAHVILLRLKYSWDTIKAVETLVRTHMRPLDAGPAGMRRLIRDTGDLFPLWRELKEKDSLACKTDADLIINQLKEFDVTIEEVRKGPAVSFLANLAVNGNDLIAAGFEPGPKMGELLRALHEKVIDNPELNTRDTLLAFAKELYKEL